MEAYKGERHTQSKDWYKAYYTNCLVGYDQSSEVILQFENAISLISALAPGTKLLDVGCATGVFLDVARRRGFQVTGTDVSPDMVEYARREFAIDARLGYLETQGFGDGEFDAVTLLDVIEHIPTYETVMTELARIIKPGGVLLLRTPTEDGLMRRLAKLLFEASGRRFEMPMLWFYSFEHVNSFDQGTLSKLVEKYGFRVEHCHDESETPERLSIPGYVKAALRIFEAFARFFGLRHKIVLIARKPV
ncbi:MAG: class I SAM-dependent methyltransferase [Elusimicrobia bacterium]|nr:class I SAM-dependent methyltransferase [Elusimicrobiota bacterium]